MMNFPPESLKKKWMTSVSVLGKDATLPAHLEKKKNLKTKYKGTNASPNTFLTPKLMAEK